jgi:hypothetical protein
VLKILNILKSGKHLNKKMKWLPFFRVNVQPYMISWIKYNPQDGIARVQIPILIINGTIQVSSRSRITKKQSQAELI